MGGTALSCPLEGHSPLDKMTVNIHNWKPKGKICFQNAVIPFHRERGLPGSSNRQGPMCGVLSSQRPSVTTGPEDRQVEPG